MTEHDFLDKVKTRGYYKSFTVDLTYQAIRQNGKLFKKQAMVEGANDIESLVTHFATHKPQIVNHKKFTFDGIINAVVRHNFRGLWWRGGEREPFTSAEVRHFRNLYFLVYLLMKESHAKGANLTISIPIKRNAIWRRITMPLPI